LPEAVFAAPAHGTWNVHASLLPRHRGASPIQHAILAGDEETGVTLMLLTAGLDEGPMLLDRKIRIAPDDTAGTLTHKLADLGATALLEGLRFAKKEGLPIIEQDNTRATYAKLLEKEDGKLDFTQPAAVLARRIRALSPWPGAFVPQKDGQPLKIIRARAHERTAHGAPGTVVETGPKELWIAAAEGVLVIEELQAPGKKPMTAAEWLRGAGRHLRNGAPFPDC
jgi:methionyl-tRNA formyltransferase